MSEKLPPRRWSDPIGAPQWRVTKKEGTIFLFLIVGCLIAISGLLLLIAHGG